MAKKERQIIIFDLDDPEDKTKFKLDAKERLSMEFFNVNFPRAKGLRYFDEDHEACAVPLEGGFLIIPAGITKFHAFYGKEGDDRIPIGRNKNEKAVKTLLSQLEQNQRIKLKENASPNKNSSKPKYKKSVTEESALPLSSKKKMKVKSTKILKFGWVHKAPGQLSFKPVSKPFGGFIHLELDMENRDFTASVIKDKVLDAFSNDITEPFIQNLFSINLGLHDGQIIKDFSTIDGEPCDLWTFLDSHRFSSKTHLYLVTEEAKTTFADNEKKKSGTPDDNEKEKLDSHHNEENVFTLPTIENEKQTNSNGNGSPVNNNNGLYTPITTEVYVQTHNFSPCTKASKFTQTEASIFQDNLITNNLTSCNESYNQNQSFQDNETNNAIDQSYENISDPPVLPEEIEAVEVIVDDTQLIEPVRVLYTYRKQSEYTDRVSSLDLSKDDLYYQICSLNPVSYSIDEFDPCADGYSISRIEQGQQTLLEIITNEKGKRRFNFPLLEDSHEDFEYHHILYDIRYEINGKFCYCVIPSCTDFCKPLFNWYRNRELYKSGEFFYYIECDNSDLITYQVKCSKIDPNDDKANVKTGLPLISKEQFIISKFILGAGAQGTAKKGSYLGTDVAVKSIIITNDSIMKDITNEISVVEVVRHPNIIQVLGVCFDIKKIHILMELFSNITLNNIIFDDDIKKRFNFDLDMKNSLAKQLCLAVAYLHGQYPQILHRDIKCDNILVNSYGVLKLSDLGMSKICKPSSLLRTTCVRGTYLYMAPELVLNTSQASTSSDVWAVACTLVELYGEKTIWHECSFKSENDLVNSLQNGLTPSVNEIPDGLKCIVKRCFSMNPLDRPNVSDLLNFYNEQNKYESDNE